MKKLHMILLCICVALLLFSIVACTAEAEGEKPHSETEKEKTISNALTLRNTAHWKSMIRSRLPSVSKTMKR